MLVATHGIGATGGHFDGTNGFRDMLFGAEPDWSDGIADGPDAIRKAVRFEVKNGADVIKAAVSGGVLSLADEVDVPQLDPAEMAALVDETHRLRKKSRSIATVTRRPRKRSTPVSTRSSTARS